MAKWYQSTVGILIAGFVAFILVLVLVFLFFTYQYFSVIKAGGGPDLEHQFVSQFTALKGAPAGQTKIDRGTLEASSLPPLGTPGAPITIVEFVDFKCPNCRLAEPIMQQVVAAYGKKVSLLVRHFPIEELHPGAVRASALVACANATGAAWSTVNLLFSRQDEVGDLTGDAFNSFIASIGLKQPAIGQCMSSRETLAAVQKDYVAGLGFGVRGTPTFFVNGEKWEGVIPFAVWKKYIENFK